MPKTTAKRAKVLVAVLSGLLVGVMAAATHLLMMPPDRAIALDVLIGDWIAALAAVIVCLAIQLHQEEIHYQTSIERAAIVAELNHNVRNAVFPLSLAIQKVGDADAVRIAEEALERINIALQDATADAFSGRVGYGNERSSDRTAE
jgi:hypothetical protein